MKTINKILLICGTIIVLVEINASGWAAFGAGLIIAAVTAEPRNEHR